jgi:hypothetical protein
VQCVPKVSLVPDTYDAACETITWGIACTALGVWWWPAAPIGIAIWLAAWQWLRRAVHALSQAAAAGFDLYEGHNAVEAVLAGVRHHWVGG